jgi:hypothetical protein
MALNLLEFYMENIHMWERKNVGKNTEEVKGF